MFWAEVANAEGDYAADRLHLEECLPVFAEQRDTHRLAMVRSDLAHGERRQGRTAKAKALYRQTMPVWQELGNWAAVAHQLECLAYLARATGEAERAARLLGAAESARAAPVAPREPSQQAEHELALVALRGQLDEAAIAQAWATGRALTLDQAVEYALSEQDP